MDLKLSDGDEGEVLIKAPFMFSKLVNGSWMMCRSCG